MKRMFYKLSIAGAISLFTLSCFGSDDDGMPSQCGEIQRYIDEYVAASNAFANNPTYLNCSQAKSKADLLLNVLRACDDYHDNSAYEEAAEALTNIDCSQF